jgi:alkyl hydroperoxide reductase subunit AhpF
MSDLTITVVRAPACHLCDDVQEALARAGAHSPFRFELIDADSSAGIELVRCYRPAAFPLILVNGEFFSQGRLSRGKLQALLDAQPAASSR